MTATIKPMKGNWVPEQDVHRQKVLGKAMEESGEYTSAVARCLIQGIDENEPVTGKPNRQWLMEEAADVTATLRHLVNTFELDQDFINARAQRKYAQLAHWYGLEPGAELGEQP